MPDLANLPHGLATWIYWEWWESDLSQFVSDFYGHPWRLQQQGDCMPQDSYLKVHVDGLSHGEDGVDPWATDDYSVVEAEKILTAWAARPAIDPTDWLAVLHAERDADAPSVDLILWDLCRKGIIPVGEYLITVWW